MILSDKEPVKRAEKSLKKFNSEINVIYLKNSARTAIEAASSLGCEVGAIVKSLLFKTDNTYSLFLVAGDKKVSLNKIKKTLNLKNVCMATAEEVKKVTGYTIGGVSPTGHLIKIRIYIDENLQNFRSIFAAAGHPNAVFEIDFKNLKALTSGETKEITE